MKKIFILIFLFALSASVHSQTKYLIYFKDKGVSPNNSLQKSSALFKLAEKELSQRAIERRKQVMGEDNYITYEDLPLIENYINQIENLGIKIENKLKWFNAVSAYLTDEQLSSLKSLSSIQKIEKVRVFKSRNDEIKLNESSANNSNRLLNKTSSTTGLDYGGSFTQNNLSDIPVVHDLGIKGTGVYIGILDDGFSYLSYQALKNLTVLRQYDYVHHLSTVSNQSGHGSSVFCLMAGNDPGNAIGPAYDAKFFLAETENDASETHAEEDNYAAALQDMEGAGVDITSSSLGYTLFDAGQSSYTYADMNGNTTIVAQAANLAFQRGLTSFTAAGNYNNDGWWIINSPADAFNIISVGAVNSGNILASFSLPGPTADGRIKPEVCAMGSGNYVALPPNGISYGTGSGTSYATPIAAGIAALLKSCWPHLINVQIRKIFLECGDNSASPNNGRGWGLISAKRVISYPNLSKTNNVYNVINKIFIDANGVKSSTVSLNYKVGSGSYQTVSMDTVVFNNTLKYKYVFPASINGDSVKFYFQYQTTGGSSVREPAGSNYYKFSYGSMNISNLTSVKNNDAIPSQFYLLQNYPNPFNPSTVISYKLSVTSKVSLKVYDLLGREVATLVNEERLPGSYNSQFSIQNSQLPSGVYFYRLQAGDFSETKKMILIK
ncbi:MAG: S8 family peptidase [Ignavibacteriales bacterium]|nr:S8 family peptidase [Ignavibacteriales bacterium]